MNRTLARMVFAAIMALLSGFDAAAGTSRYLILDFDCHGGAAGQSAAIGDALRKQIVKFGEGLVSRDLFEKTIKQRRLNESDLNYTVKDLRDVLMTLGGNGAAFGNVYTYEDMFTIEMRYLEPTADQPVLFDPIVCGSVDDIFQTIPHLAAMIISPDKIPPVVMAVDPPDGSFDIGQVIDMKIVFSEPMNPSTISVSALPEDMWTRFGDVDYDDGANSFKLKFYLYPGIDYVFQVNGEDSKGFKDLAGNPARSFTWRFKTSP